MRSSHVLRLLLLAVGTASLAVLAAATTASAQTSRHRLPGTKPSWTAAVQQSGAVPAANLVRAKVWLTSRNTAQLDALAQAVSDPSSAQYGQFLTTAQYDAQFAPDQAQVSAVTQWLTSSGLNVDAVGADNHYVAVSGGAAAVNAAFGTQLGRFVVNGQVEQAPTSDLTVPDSVAGYVQAVTGLTTFGHMVKPADLGAPDAFVNGTPCSSYYGQVPASNLPQFQGTTVPYAPCGYTPDQFRSVYGVDDAGPGNSGGHGGNGSTVAITDAFDASTLLADANTYSQRHGDKRFVGHQFEDRSVAEDTTKADACGGNGWYGEQTLDIEAVHGMAQNANVLYYGAASCFDDDLLAQLAQVVHDNDASIVTNSWGEPTFVVIDGTLYITIDDTLVNAYESVFKQGALQGIGFYFSSGDNGDELAAWGYKHPDWPTEDPWVTSVGGTTLAVDRHGVRQFETGWGTQKFNLSGNAWTQTVPFLYGAGGGFSQVFDRPLYQQGVVPASTTGRAVPDIGLDGDPTTGMLVGETQNFPAASRFGPAGVHYGEFRLGGTSLSSPLLAGFQAVAQSELGHRTRIGFANPLIYLLKRLRPNVFYDVTPQGDAGNVRADYANGVNADGGIVYTVRTFDHDSSLVTNPGWDDVTGVGSPTAAYFDILRGRIGR